MVEPTRWKNIIYATWIISPGMGENWKYLRPLVDGCLGLQVQNFIQKNATVIPSPQGRIALA